MFGDAVELIVIPIVAHAQFALLFSLVLYIMPALLLRILLEEWALKAKFGAVDRHYL